MAGSEANYASDTNSNPSSSVIGQNGVTGNTSDFQSSSTSTQIPKNKLHDYTSYTYRITLFFLTAKDFNTLAASPSTFEPKYSLISSAGGYANPSSMSVEVNVEGASANVADTRRHPDFLTDFFIDNLQLQTVVGLNAKTKSTNAIDISFTITEPYGMSLLDRLLSACETSEDAQTNYMTQPYLLQVDLLASPTDEQLDRLKTTNNLIDRKRIPIKLLEMKIKPTGSGTTYACRAMPFNHSAFDMTTAALPVTMNIEASTVGEFFSTTDDFVKLFSDQIQAEEERLESEIGKWINDNTILNGGSTPTPEQIKQKKDSLKNAIVFNSKSLTAGYNTYMKKIADDQKLTKYAPTLIAFNIPSDEIAKSPIVDKLAQASDTKMSDATSGIGKSDPTYKKVQTFSINPGTSIIDVIDQVMGKSDYIKNQIITEGKSNNDQSASEEYSSGSERTESNTKQQNLKWYRVVPSVVLNDFDTVRNSYSKTVLYTILPYSTANAYHPNFPKSTGESALESVVRKYDYLYTGLNRDILRLDIDFDNTYYTQITTYRDQVKRLGNDASSDPNDVVDSKFSNREATTNILPQTTEVVGSNKDANSMNTSTNPNEKIVADLKKSIYSNQRGDMLNIKLQIIGDPDFIKQDDVYYNPSSPEEYAKIVDNRLKAPIVSSGPNSGQILFDAEQVYVQVNFKNAVDIDDSKGIVNKQDLLRNGRRTDGTFSGVYKLLTVQSEFNRGQFTQTLDLVRMPDPLPKAVTVSNQPVNNESSDYSGRSPSTVNNATVNTISPELPGVINQGTGTI